MTIALVLGLAGCGSGTNSQNGSLSSSTPPTDGGRYAHAHDLVAAMEKANAACTDYTPIANPIGAIERGSCNMSDQVVLSIYATSADAEAEPKQHAEIMKGISAVNMVVGQNWTANCTARQDCDKIASSVGGKPINIPA